MVPIDFSEASVRALRYVQGLATGRKTYLTLLNVMESPRSFRMLDAAAQERKRKNECMARLRNFARAVVGTGVPIKAIVRTGVPVEEISRLAASYGPDMIIMGRHMQRGFWHWFRRGTVARLVRCATCPVIAL
jgi:universal stress protein A